jgi:hypothetical protein
VHDGRVARQLLEPCSARDDVTAARQLKRVRAADR